MHCGMPEHFIKHAKEQFLTKVFIDTEFTHLFDALQPEPAELISIGCISVNGKQFYAENADFSLESCSEFVIATVLPLLEHGDKKMPYQQLANTLKDWVETFDDEVVFYSDSPSFDWPFVQHMFDHHGWPVNLRIKAEHLGYTYERQQIIFRVAVMQAMKKFQLREHHALDDAIANKLGYERVLSMSNQSGR